jgi:ATP-dependent Clp protease ATP-binding subunit ClpC
LEDPLAEEIIKSKLNEGDTIKVSLDSNKKEISISISKPRKSKKTESEE